VDEVKNLGNFVEVEILGESSPDKVEQIKEMAMMPGLEEKDRVWDIGYPDMIMYL
jgi:adenylate cyclase class IV